MRTSTLPSTRSRSHPAHGATAKPEERPCLYLVLNGLHLTAAPARFELDGIREVRIGRHESGVRFEAHGDRLEIGFADPQISRRHATLRRSRSWLIEDHSKNGTFVNGARVTGAVPLSDGDIIEIQYLFFLFRAHVARNVPELPPQEAFATLNSELARTFSELGVLARTPIPIALVGQTGTGKEVVARTIHTLSGRTGSFVAVNCGAIPSGLTEHELFGSTGPGERLGLIRAAHRGTLFLDGIADLPLPAQVALLRAIQEREVVPVGSVEPIAVDFRLVSSSHQELGALVAAGQLRPELHARITGRRVLLPPLHERREDIGLLIGGLLRKLLGAEPDADCQRSIRPVAARALLLYDWPGNIRQLENALSAAIVLAGSERIALAHLPPELQAHGEPPFPRATTTKRARKGKRKAPEAMPSRERIVRLLAENNGNVSAAARAMGTRRTQLQRWIKRLQIRKTPRNAKRSG